MRFHIGLSLNWKTIKKWLIPIGIGILLFLGYSSMTVHAVSVPSVRNGMNYFYYSYDGVTISEGTQAFALSGALPIYPFYGQTKNYDNFSWRGIEFIAESPVQGQGISYIITAKFKILMDGLSNAIANSTFTGCVQFEQGTIVQKTCNVEVSEISTDGAIFTIQSSIGLQSTTDLSSLLFSLYATNGTIGTYHSSDSTTVFTTQLSLLDVDVTISQDPNTAILGGIQDEQEKTNEKLDDLKDKQDETNKELGDLNDNITDSTVDEDAGSSFFDNFSTEDNGGISGIITAPLTLINSLLDNQGTCTDLEFPILGKDVAIPSGCMLWDKVPSEIEIIVQMIVCGTGAYFILTKLFKDINDLKDPNKQGVSTLDL